MAVHDFYAFFFYADDSMRMQHDCGMDRCQIQSLLPSVKSVFEPNLSSFSPGAKGGIGIKTKPNFFFSGAIANFELGINSHRR